MELILTDHFRSLYSLVLILNVLLARLLIKLLKEESVQPVQLLSLFKMRFASILIVAMEYLKQQSNVMTATLSLETAARNPVSKRLFVEMGLFKDLRHAMTAIIYQATDALVFV